MPQTSSSKIKTVPVEFHGSLKLKDTWRNSTTVLFQFALISPAPLVFRFPINGSTSRPTFTFPAHTSLILSMTRAAAPERCMAMASLTFSSGNVWVTRPSRLILPAWMRLMSRGIYTSGATLPPCEPLRTFLKWRGSV